MTAGATQTTTSDVDPVTRRAWLWPIQIGHGLALRIDRCVLAVAPMCAVWRAYALAALAGTVPLLASYATGLGGHQVVSALIFSVLFLALVRADRFGAGIGCIGIAFATHSALAIALSAFDPAAMSAILPDGHAYWNAQLQWITSGADPEYEVSTWLPQHVHLLLGVEAFSYCSLGSLVFVQGFYEVDLMNYYVGRLVVESRSAPLALTTGWHIWSLLRGVAYSILVFETVSLSLDRMVFAPISTRSRRLRRWSLGLGFFIADCVVKFAATTSVRQFLFDNLL